MALATRLDQGRPHYSPGPLTMRDVLSMLPFNNPIVKGEVRQAARRIPNTASPQCEDNEPGRFPQVSGMSFKSTPQTSRQRVSDIMVGANRSTKKNYTLATSDFLVSAAGTATTCQGRKRLIRRTKHRRIRMYSSRH